MRYGLILVLTLAVAVGAGSPVCEASSRSASLVYAPSGADEGSGYGIEFWNLRSSGRLSGWALWFAGSLGPSPDVDDTIPHGYYTSQGYDSRWGLVGLVGQGNERAAIIAGIGVAFVHTRYVDTSLATGWTWDGGAESKVETQGQIGAVVGLGKTTALRAGWDSQFGAFGGLSWRF